MNKYIQNARIPVELKHLQNKNHGIKCYPVKDDDFTELLAIMPGPADSIFDGFKFKLSITTSEQYPFRPSTYKFITPVFHPNIDSTGKICLDLLRMPPTGSYNPAITLEAILLSIQLLLANPNPDDPLNGDAADLYKTNRQLYNKLATDYLRQQKMDIDDEEQVEQAKPTETNNSETIVTRATGALPKKKLKLRRRYICVYNCEIMADFMEQRSCIKFCYRNEISAAKTYRMLRKAFGEHTISQKNTFKWYKLFKEGRERIEDENRSGRPSKSKNEQNIEQIKNLVQKNHQLTIRDIAIIVGISKGTVNTILKDILGLRRVKTGLVADIWKVNVKTEEEDKPTEKNISETIVCKSEGVLPELIE